MAHNLRRGSLQGLRFQFGLRTCLLLFVVFAAAASWLRVRSERSTRLQALIDKIHQCNGFVQYDYEFDESGKWNNAEAQPPPGPAWMRRIAGDSFFCEPVSVSFGPPFEPGLQLEHGIEYAKALPHLKYLTVFSPSDAALAKISQCPRLEELWMTNWPAEARLDRLNASPCLRVLRAHMERASDAAIRALCSVRIPICLYLEGGEITRAGAECLQKIPELRVLAVERTHIDDQMLYYIGGCSQLSELDLEGADISDSGLEYLVRLRNLKLLDVSSTRVTAAGVAKLQHQISARTRAPRVIR